MNFRLISMLAFAASLVTTPAFGQLASYPLDGNANDIVGGSDGVASGTVTWQSDGDRDFAAVGTDGLITLPLALGAGLFDSASIRVEADFRPRGTDKNSVLFSSNASGPDAIWQEEGFLLLQMGSELVLSYSDGLDPSAYEWQTVFTGLETDQWYQLEFFMDISKRYWSVKINNSIADGLLLSGIDLVAFVAGAEGYAMTVGGASGQSIPAFDGPFDIDNLTIYAPGTTPAGPVNNAFDALRDDILGITPLTQQQLEDHVGFIRRNLYQSNYNAIADSLFNYTDAYEGLNPPLYADGVSRYENELPVHARALLYAQVFVFNSRFLPSFASSMGGVVFEHHQVIPGPVAPTTPRIASAVVEINGSYSRDIAAELTDQSRVVRPTGYFLAAGDVVTVHAPPSVIDSGLSIVVGAHFRNMNPSEIGAINRYQDISLEFPLDQETISVANPFGGLIYVKVPEGSAEGWFNLSLSNAIKSPYFSWREGRKTDITDWLNQVADSGAPWADFESDKYMFTIPAHLLAGVQNPGEIMQRWDAIMDAIRLVGGRPAERPRAEYFTADTRLVTPAFGAGYPLVITLNDVNTHDDWNPLKVLNTVPNAILFHEMGHNHLQPTLHYGDPYNACNDIEAETIVHMLATSIRANVYSQPVETAFENSFGYTTFSLDEAAFDWIVTQNFRHNQPINFDGSVPMDDKDMLKYQFRGWAKYADIARLFGWDGLASVNGAFYTPGVEQAGTVCPERPFITGRDEYIRAAVEQLGENVTPLLHFWGINPSPGLVSETSVFPKSQAVKQRIEAYRCGVAPDNITEYQQWHNQVYDRVGYQQPRYDEYLAQFDAQFATDIQGQFDFLMSEYGLQGPTAPSQLQGFVDGAQVTLTWQDNSADEDGFVVEFRPHSSVEFELLALAGPDVEAYVTDALPAGTYDFRVSSRNVEGLWSEHCAAQAGAVLNLLIDPGIFHDGFEGIP